MEITDMVLKYLVFHIFHIFHIFQISQNISFKKIISYQAISERKTRCRSAEAPKPHDLRVHHQQTGG